jgi:hypothetical protein
MALPKYLTKITPFSMYLSMILFVFFPFLAFYLGIQYQIMVTPTYPPTQYIQPPEVRIVPHEVYYLTITATPAISCRPRPACLDAKPRCMIAVTADMCPPSSPPIQIHSGMQK